MKIGIDLSAIQGPHRMRGIGAVLINFINTLPPNAKTEHVFIFFMLPIDDKNLDPLELLELSDVTYETREIPPFKKYRKILPGRLNLLVGLVNQARLIRDLRFGDSRIPKSELKELSAFFQVDPIQPLPKSRRKLRNVLFLHDLIPYALEWDYLWSYKTARAHSRSRKVALRDHVSRFLYAYKLKAVTKHADVLLANSECTKNDFVHYFALRPKHITVTHLGITLPSENVPTKAPTTIYKDSAWGYFPTRSRFDTTTPFILFVGGADKRRKIADIVTAFNMLRAQGTNLKLVLAGDSMQGPMNISTVETQQALKTSSYLSDIVFLGFPDKETIAWLYAHTAAFIFPSRYEGFGLPVLEALSYGAPVVSYSNAATKEVAGNLPTYVDDALGIKDAVETLLHAPNSNNERQVATNHRRKQAAKFTWDKTTERILGALSR